MMTSRSARRVTNGRKIMVNQVIGKLPEFTSDETSEETGQEEVKEAAPEEGVEEEKETPAEPPAEEKPAEEGEKPEGEDVGELAKQTEALTKEREALLKDIQDLRGERRDLKKERLDKVEEAIDDLKDTHPEDVKLIERVLKSKGYVRKEDVDKRIYDEVKEQQLNSFLDKHPEYKPENDPQDLNWSRFQKELQFYRMPQDPKKVGEVLERAHKALAGFSGGQDLSAKRHLAKTAGVGGGIGKGPSSGTKSLSSEQREEYRRGGWSEEEISKIEKQLE